MVTIVAVPVGGDIITIDIPNFAQNFPGAREMRLVRIPEGTFQMGSPDTESNRDSDEGQLHWVTITNDFYIGETEVTQAQWQAVMGSNPASSYGVDNDYPVYNVSWNDIRQSNGFLDRLDAQSSFNGFRLPTEAEWEYACRAETSTRFSFGDELSCNIPCAECSLPDQYMWWCGNNNSYSSHPVGIKYANAFGLFDMHGNIWEWCEDWYQSDFYSKPGATAPNPLCTDSTTGYRVMRGGYWYTFVWDCRSANRDRHGPGSHDRSIGVRVVLSTSP